MESVQGKSCESDRMGLFGVLAVAVLALVLANLPHAWGFLKSNENHVFSGTLSNNLDQLSYYAKMRAGFNRHWTYENLYTTEPTKPVPIFMFYIVLGRFARLTGLSLIVTNQLARVAAGIFLLFMLDRLIRALGWRGGRRVLAMALVVLGSGAGWLQGFGFADKPIELRPLEYWLIEGYVFESMANYAHFAFGSALLVGIMTEGATAGREGWSLWRIVRSVLFAFLLAWVHPRLLAVPIAVFLLAGAIEMRGGISRLKAWWIGTAFVVLGGAVPGALMLSAIRGDGTWRATLEPVMLSPGILPLLLGYGLLWPLAFTGVWRVLKEPQSESRWLAAWLLAGFVLIWLPFDSQRRFIQGFNIPLALLALVGAEYAARAWIFRGAWTGMAPRFAAAALALILSLGSCFYTAHEMARIGRGKYPTFWSEEYAAGMAWIERYARSDEVIMCSLENGILVPPLTGRRVVLGHWAETFNAAQKEREVKEFFDASTAPERREEIVKKHDIKFVIHNEHERALGGFDPASDPEHWNNVWTGIEMKFYRRLGLPEDPKKSPKGPRA